MGGGKTSAAINMIEDSPSDKHFLFITPFVKEGEAVCCKIKNRSFFSPEGEHKGIDVVKSIKSNKDIVCTHELFKRFSYQTLDMLKSKNYTLIIDEEISVLDTVSIPKVDYDIIFGNQTSQIVSDSNGKVNWNVDIPEDSMLYRYKKILDGKFSELGRDGVIITALNPKYFYSFSDVYVLTYLFKGSILKCYFDKFNIEYKYKDVDVIDGRYVLVDYKVSRKMGAYKSRIEIVNGKQNDVGIGKYALSKTSIERDITNDKVVCSQIKKNMYTLIRRYKLSAKDIIWTTGKAFYDDLKGTGYSLKSCFLPMNARATNDYNDRSFVAYLLNVFPPTGMATYFVNKKTHKSLIDQDMYALSTLVQFVWRSSIRNNDNSKIVVYIPSERMRTLFVSWLDSV